MKICKKEMVCAILLGLCVIQPVYANPKAKALKNIIDLFSKPKPIVVKPKPSLLRRIVGVGETIMIGGTLYTVATQAQASDAAKGLSDKFSHCELYVDENNEPYVDEATNKSLYLCVK